MILLVSPDQDEHGTEVANRLREAGAAFLRLAPVTLWRDAAYSIAPLAPGFGVNRPLDGLRFDGGEPAATAWETIYWRRSRTVESRITLDYPLADEVAAAEAYHAVRLALEALPAALFPLGHPLPLEQSANKLRQLHLAAQAGFSVPDTLVGNDAGAHLDFLRRHPRVVVKPLHASVAYQKEDRTQTAHLLWCRGLPATALLERLRPEDKAQLLLQQAIKKTHDWRITVLPHLTICCEIETASLPEDQPDWRKQTLALPHRIIDLPPEFDRLLRRFLSQLNLTAGYFDFAVATDGTPFFLELNTNANWLWIERLTGCSISGEIAKCLRRVV